jgi:hypothetical protein
MIRLNLNNSLFRMSQHSFNVRHEMEYSTSISLFVLYIIKQPHATTPQQSAQQAVVHT